MACTDHCSQLLEDMLTIVRDECRGMSDAPPLRNSAKYLERPVSGRCRPGLPRIGQSRPMSALVVLLGQTGFGLHGRYDDETWLRIEAARTNPSPFRPTGLLPVAIPAYWTWGGSNNNLNTKGTPGRDICVRAQARRGCREPPPHPPSAGHTHHTTQRPPTASPCQSGLSPAVAELELSVGAVRSPGGLAVGEGLCSAARRPRLH